MTTFNKEELLHLANLSGLPLEEHEINTFTGQINSILQYVDQLQVVEVNAHESHVVPKNIFRPDAAVRKDNALLLAQAPETDDGYIVVPKILDEK